MGKQSNEVQLMRNQRRLALLLAGFPLGLGLVVLIFNPPYLGHLFSSSVQPYGWIMAVMTLALVGAAYVALLGSFALSNRLEPPGWLLSKPTLRFCLVICVVVLLVLPAAFLVVFGPAVLIFMESNSAGPFP